MSCFWPFKTKRKHRAFFFLLSVYFSLVFFFSFFTSQTTTYFLFLFLGCSYLGITKSVLSIFSRGALYFALLEDGFVSVVFLFGFCRVRCKNGVLSVVHRYRQVLLGLVVLFNNTMYAVVLTAKRFLAVVRLLSTKSAGGVWN